MLKIDNITVQYGNNKPTIEDFSLEISSGEIVAIVGESGSGKTTVIRSVLGLLPGQGKVTKGDIVFEGAIPFSASYIPSVVSPSPC